MYKRAIISITDECNLRCVHCYNANNRGQLESKTEWINEKFAQSLQKLGIQHVGLTGGEPLMRWDSLISYIRLFKKHGFYVVITTNGTLLNSEKLDELTKEGSDLIQISLDGAYPETHDAIRGKGSFAKTFPLFISPKYKKYNLFPMFTICKINYMEIEAYLTQLVKNGVKQVGFERYIPSSGLNVQTLSLTREMLQQAYDTILAFEGKINIHVNDPVYSAYKLAKLKIPDAVIQNMATWNLGCSAGNTSMYIDAKGNVYPCTFSNRSFFNVRDDNIDNIPNRQDLCKAKEGTKCFKCRYSSICGGCRASAQYYDNENSDWEGNDPLCMVN